MPAAVRSINAPAPPIPQVPQLPKELTLLLANWLRDLRETLNAGGNSAFLVANLPSTTPANNPPNVAVPFEGQWAFALDGRKVGEGAGAGTGVPCYFSNGQWRRPSDDTQVVA